MTTEQLIKALLEESKVRLIDPSYHNIPEDKNSLTIERLGRRGDYLDLFWEEEWKVIVDIDPTEIELI